MVSFPILQPNIEAKSSTLATPSIGIVSLFSRITFRLEFALNHKRPTQIIQLIWIDIIENQNIVGKQEMRHFQQLPIRSTHLKTCDEALALGLSKHLTESFHSQNEQVRKEDPPASTPYNSGRNWIECR